MKEIYVDVLNTSKDSIKIVQGDNNSEKYKLILTKDNKRMNLTNKNVKLAFCNTDNNSGDIIDNLEVCNPKNGEVLLPITNIITKQEGIYSCQIAIYGENDYLEHTTYFSITVRENLFLKIGKEIPNNQYSKLSSLIDGVSKLDANLKKAEILNSELNDKSSELSNKTSEVSKIIDDFNKLDLNSANNIINQEKIVTLKCNHFINDEFTLNYPDDSWNSCNTLIIQVIGTTVLGEKKQLNNIDIFLNEFSISGKINREKDSDSDFDWNMYTYERNTTSIFETICSIEIKIKKI